MMESEVSHLDWVGFVPFTIIMVSLVFIILASILVKPWQPKVTLVVIGTVITLFVVFVMIFLVGGALLSIWVP